MNNAATTSHEIRLVRTFAAPLQAVWDALTVDDQVSHWYGPRGFTTVTTEKSLKVGGVWRFSMQGPDQTQYPNKIQYLEVNAPQRLVYDHGDDQAVRFRVTMTLAELAGRTELTMTMAFPSLEGAEQARQTIKSASGESTWDKLAEFLYERLQKQPRFVYARTFAAPIDVVYSMFADPKHVAAWSSPAGSSMEFIEQDVRAGGSSYYVQRGAHGTMYGLVHYREFTRPNRVVYMQQFADDKRQVARHPLAATFPASMLTTVELFPEGNGHTRMQLMWEPVDVNAEEVATFAGARGGMTQGWQGSFDKLDAYLATQHS